MIVSTDVRGVRQETLANGLTILTEQMPHVRSVAVGIWVKSGSRAEPAEVNGISHFIEHTVFKGTTSRSAEQIAKELDSVGGHMDAFTSKEIVCFNAKVMDEHLPRALDVLADLVLEPLFREEDLRKEQGVVLEEIKMEQDNPEYLVQETFTQNFWPHHSIGRPILGTKESVLQFDSQSVRNFFQRWYRPERMLVTAAGRLHHDRFVELVAGHFNRLERHQETGPEASDHRPRAHAALATCAKPELEQVQLCLGVPCSPLPDQRRYIVSLLSLILGGGMSSRLFQKVREQRGLVYSIFSDASAYRDTGCFSVSAGTGHENVQQVLRLILEEFSLLKREPVPADELRRAKDNIKGGLLLSLESTSARMGSLARQQIYFGRVYDPEEILARVEAVTAEEIQQAARDFFQPQLVAAAVLGKLDGFELRRDQLAC
ncbi:MAG: M16 family metallopeptidase [Candidatus Acidiferrales bacterium]